MNGRSDSPAITFRGVTKRYGGQDALQPTDLEIEEGEFFCLLGPSGCGKTTTLRMIAGLEQNDAGRIVIGERVMSDPAAGLFVAPERREIGMVFQSYAIWPHMTVFANVAYPLEVRHRPSAEVRERVAGALRLMEMAHLAERPATALSGGQQQRVAIARALVFSPRVLLMDEPLSNLDAKLREQMRVELRALQQRLGITTVYVTHDQEEALSLADRLVVLRNGRMQQIGTSEELHTRPANWHVADFMGFRNIFEADANRVSGSEVLVRGEGLRLLGTATSEITANDRVKAAVRPEDILVTDSPAGENLIEATVEVVEYQGRELAVEARTPSGLALHLRTERRLAPGDGVTLTVSPDRLLVYPLDTDDRTAAALVEAGAT